MNEIKLSIQSGVGFVGFLLGASFLVLVSILGIKIIPAYVENAEINHLLANVANDVEMQKASHREVRAALLKQASINNIKSIKPEDVEISNEGGRMVLNISYTARVPLVGNVSLIIDFKSTSGR